MATADVPLKARDPDPDVSTGVTPLRSELPIETRFTFGQTLQFARLLH